MLGLDLSLLSLEIETLSPPKRQFLKRIFCSLERRGCVTPRGGSASRTPLIRFAVREDLAVPPESPPNPPWRASQGAPPEALDTAIR